MLQGTLDVFSLDEVLGLLSSAQKTGVLNVEGDRGNGSLSLRDGSLVDGSADLETGDGTIGSVVFELLRYSSGSFEFEADDSVNGGAPQQVAPVLVEGHERLDEWRTIAAVVPSLDHFLTLSPELGTEQITVDADEWSTIVAVGEGAAVATVGTRMNLGEVDVSRRIKGLVERSLVMLAAGDESTRPSVASLMAESTPEESTTFDPSMEHDFSSELAGLEIPEPESDPVDSVLADSVLADSVATDSVATDSVATDSVFADSVATDSVLADSLATERAPVDESIIDDEPAEISASAIPPMPEPPSFDEIDAAGLLDDSSASLLDADESADDLSGRDPLGSLLDDAPVAPAAMAAEPTEFARRSDDAFESVVPDDSEIAAFESESVEVPSFAESAFETPLADAAPRAAAEATAVTDAAPEAADEATEGAADGGSLLMRYLESNG